MILYGENELFERLKFFSFLHLKFHCSRQKHTSQKWCLEVSTTFFKEVRAKKRLSVVQYGRKKRRFLSKNHQFLLKIQTFSWNSSMSTIVILDENWRLLHVVILEIFHQKHFFFQKVLFSALIIKVKSLKRIQIEFWIAEKIGIESFTCFSKTWEIP